MPYTSASFIAVIPPPAAEGYSRLGPPSTLIVPAHCEIRLAVEPAPAEVLTSGNSSTPYSWVERVDLQKSMSTQPNLTECADCLCLASRRAARRITRTFDRALRPHGLRATQFTILVILSLRGAMTIGELAEALGAERTTLTRNLALIERASWVEIQPGEEDARSRVVTLTAKGRAVVASAFRAWRKAQEMTAASIGADGASALRALAGASLS